MPPIEWQRILSEEMAPDFEAIVQRMKEDKYALQTGLRDVDFDIDTIELTRRGFSLPFRTITQAEQALEFRLILPKQFLEFDGTDHQVQVFHPQPVGYSGFMRCATHSLALTNIGLFEVGRYAAISLDQPGHIWQWFLHRRLALPEQVSLWQEEEGLNAEQLVSTIYRAFVPGGL